MNKSAIARAKRIAWNTVDRWLQRVAASCRRFNDQKIDGIAISELQADEIRTMIHDKEQPIWIFAAIEVWSRLWPSTVVGRRSYRNTLTLFRDISSRPNLERVPLIATDGFVFYAKVIRRENMTERASQCKNSVVQLHSNKTALEATMKHIGMDVHSTTTDACVRNGSGVIVLQRQIRTTRTELIDFISSIRGQKRVVLEEDQMADWVTRVLQPHVDEVIRCQPQYNKLISASEDKCDKMDAKSLSELLYLNRVKPVHHPEMKYRMLREAVRAYWVASRDFTRAKNRLKGWYLFNGLHDAGPAIYSSRNRVKHLKALKEEGRDTELAELLYERMDACRQLKAKHIQILRKVARPVKELVQKVTTIPAIGPISGYTLVSLLEDGWRIPNKRKLWRYAGLSLRRHESRELGFEGASKSGNRLLRRVVMSAAITIVARGEPNGLLALWERDIRQNVNPKRARRNLARKIVVIAQHLLRTQQEYIDERITA